MPVDPTSTMRVLENIPEEEVELVEVIVPELVDPLPFQERGKWRGVNVERLISKRRGRSQGPTEGQVSPPAPGLMPQALARPRQLPHELMFRSLDFSVSPGRTYRYRARLVVDARTRLSRLGEALGYWSQPTDAVTVP
jgi:hypothetical protein